MSAASESSVDVMMKSRSVDNAVFSAGKKSGLMF